MYYTKIHQVCLCMHQGPSAVAYVADSGEELLRHKYDNILRCGRGTDSISFAYLSVSGKTDKCHCHVFQSLDLEEVSTHTHSA